MADLIDQANEKEELITSHKMDIIRQKAVIPTGEAGVCKECQEEFARLVAGKCAFCRDGK